MSTEEYIATYCREGVDRTSVKILIKEIEDRPLHTIAFTIRKLARSTTTHIITKSQMAYAVECMEPRVFNWCEGVLVSLKNQITRCRDQTRKNSLAMVHCLFLYFWREFLCYNPRLCYQIIP
jgi:hypothetical protein